jgi:hypothetical protein
MKDIRTSLPVAVLGAGPVGLAAAAQLLQRSLTPLILEAAHSVATNLETYRHLRLFSPWQYNVDHAAAALLSASGWQAPLPKLLPTAGQIIDDYLQPLAELPQIATALHFGHKVTHITRKGFDKVKTVGRDQAPFVIRAMTEQGEREFLAQAVIDATGTWSHPNPLGANGLPAIGETEFEKRIVYGMPDVLGKDRERYAGKRVLVVGTGHSAVGNLIALSALPKDYPGTQIVWAVRGENVAKVYGGGAADQLPARGQLGTHLKELERAGALELHSNFRIQALRANGARIDVASEQIDGQAVVILEIDEIIASTGARPDLALAGELRLRLDPWLEATEAIAPLIDPNLHSCGTVRPHGHRELAHPEPGYYTVGAKSYGRAPNFLMATGYEQVRSVVAALAGDIAAADDVQLELPETGVCSVRPPSGISLAKISCCGGPAPAKSDACCALDAEAKAKGDAGCGCASNETKPTTALAKCCG